MSTAAPETIWVDTADGLERVVGELAGEPLIGLDTEFHRERTYFPHVALVQLAWTGGIALVDAPALDLGPLAPVLAGPAVFVMHAAAQDLEVLDRACGAVPVRLFDTQLAAGFAGYSTPSLANLVDGELGIRLPKGDRLADWLRRPLSEDQQSYAAGDVAHLLVLHHRLTKRLGTDGRLAWAEAECEDLRQRALVRRQPDEAWWRIKEARQLRGQAVGVAQALAAWRELTAMRTDQPLRFVLPDLALVGMAQRPPRDENNLRQVRGLDGRHLRGGLAKEILDAVRRGADLSRAELCFPPSVGEVERDLRPAVALVSAWISQLGRQLRIDATLLATRADIESLVRGDDGARLTQGWRAAAVGDNIRRLVGGDAALAFDGNGGLVLETRSGRSL